MTISTQRTDRPAISRLTQHRPARKKGFTLLEVMIATVLSTIVLAGVLSAFLMIGRTSFNSSSYSELEAETRRALEIFGQDARGATDIRWRSEQSVTLAMPPTSTAPFVTYAYDDVAGSSTRGCFYRVLSDDPLVGSRQILARNVAPDLAFQRYKLEQTGVPVNSAANDLETKQLQLTLRAVRRGTTTVTVSHRALSACYVLRNKRVTN